MKTKYSFCCSKCGHGETFETTKACAEFKKEHKKTGCHMRIIVKEDCPFAVREQIAIDYAKDINGAYTSSDFYI